jgi:nicotinamidase-related amidase
MRIVKSETAAILIDVQERLFPHIEGFSRLEAKLITLLQGLQALEIPLIITEQYTRGLGDTIAPLRTLTDGIPRLEKMTFSCCGEPSIMEALHKTEKKFFLLAGIETHVCVMQTAIDLLAEGKIPVIIEDCVSSRKPEDKRIAIERLRADGAIITGLESLLFELCLVSGTPVFKKISSLVK